MQPAARRFDPADPATWFRLLVDAVAGLQAGKKEPAVVYLQFVQEHRGRSVAEAARRQIAVLAKADSWKHASYWRANGYSTRDPRKAKTWR